MCKSLSYSDHRKGDVEMGKRKKKIATHAINAQGQQSTTEPEIITLQPGILIVLDAR